MAKEYYYFVSGLPVQSSDDTKLSLTPLTFMHSAKEHLDESDYNLLCQILIPNDITNLVHTLQNKDHWQIESNVTKAEWEKIITVFREHRESSPVNRKQFKKHIPPFMIDFIQKHLQTGEVISEYEMYKQLFSTFYELIKHIDNKFLQEWFRFDSDIKNVVIALNSRKHNLPYQDQLIGSNELTEKLIKSKSGDFGLGRDFPYFSILSRLNEQTDIIEKEKGFDALRWKWIETRTFYEYFTIPRILGYFIRLSIVHRWIHLSQTAGEKHFNKVLHDLETSFEFPEEFALNKR